MMDKNEETVKTPSTKDGRPPSSILQDINSIQTIENVGLTIKQASISSKRFIKNFKMESVQSTGMNIPYEFEKDNHVVVTFARNSRF
jgi:hypothetical protein